ncbi:sentrin-specific protease 1-like [Olea europaea subsp. europaea]|uniref:Sentrin-specific protease 1-like n=1 Tax=Olea europaea subsp. europaea TaxID=158383 RepID=A0A8S0S779_OLEEU|nr:sentrin-specific protease 1-like [Olea europaea subsp. europaea]
MIVAFQAWIYETFPSLDGIMVTRILRVHTRSVNWMTNEQSSAVKLEGPDCFSNPKIEICDLERWKVKWTERTIEDAGTSEKSVSSVLQLMDSSIRQAHSSDDDDNFVAPTPRWSELSAHEKSPVVEGPSVVHHFQEEPQSHGTQRDDASEELRVQVSKLQADNKVLNAVLDEIKSQMSSLNEGKNNKMDDIVQMQACIKSDLMNIRTNMQFLSESVSAMVSSAMDEIIRRSDDRTSERGVGQTEVGDQEHHPAFGSDKAQERVDSIISDVVTETKTVGNEGSPTSEPTSELPVKWVLRPVRVLQFPFVAGWERMKLFKHNDNVVIFEDYKDNVDEVEKSAFMSWFQRAYKPKNKKKFSEEDDSIKPAFLIGSFPIGKSYRDWKVKEGIEPYIKLLSTIMNALGISKKDPDYQEPEAKELNVIIDNTLPQQTNGHDCKIFVVLYVLYIICGGRCSILHRFDANKFRMDIDTMLYRHRQVYTMTVNPSTTMMRELLIIE